MGAKTKYPFWTELTLEYKSLKAMYNANPSMILEATAW